MNNSDSYDRRNHSRMKLNVPVEIKTDANSGPLRGATADLSSGGCYIETIFPLPIGTSLNLRLFLETTILIDATVVTSDPQVGYGIRFVRMLPEDREALQTFLKAHQQIQEPGTTTA